MPNTRVISRLGLATLWALVAGCGGDAPKLARVTGTVTFGGRPLDGATVIFEPTGGGLPPSVGTTDASGKYELQYSRDASGATIGEQVVRITSFGSVGEDCERQIVPEKIPARYNMKSELKASVQRGSNTFDFNLQPGGEIIQPDAEQPAARPAVFTGCQ